MSNRRRPVLVALLAVVGITAAALLHRVLATVFFGITIATVLVPYYQFLRRRGLSQWWASAVATLTAFVGALSLVLPIVVVLYTRREQLVEVLSSLPEEFVFEMAEFTYTIDTGDATASISVYMTDVALAMVRSVPALVAHATVLGFVVFGLLLGRHRVRRALILPAFDSYHDVSVALYVRARETLFALYVIQAVTALGTFVVAFVLFWALGYQFPVTLGVIAGLLQFLPVVGPSILVIAIAAYEVSVGTYFSAALVLALGLPLVAFLPDALLRPRLARETAGLPASLYFVGFTGGLLSVGPVGIIAGPLVVALLSETLAILAREPPVSEATPPPDPPVVEPPSE